MEVSPGENGMGPEGSAERGGCPVALLPLFLAIVVTTCGLRYASVGLLLHLFVAGALLWPMMAWQPIPDVEKVLPSDTAVDPLRLRTTKMSFGVADRTAGLKAFLGGWKMNDFIFLIASENMAPDNA